MLSSTGLPRKERVEQGSTKAATALVAAMTSNGSPQQAAQKRRASLAAGEPSTAAPDERNHEMHAGWMDEAAANRSQLGDRVARFREVPETWLRFASIRAMASSP